MSPAEQHLHKLFQHHLLGHVQELVQVHTSVGELPEGTLLLDLGFRLKKRYSIQAKYVFCTQNNAQMP